MCGNKGTGAGSVVGTSEWSLYGNVSEMCSKAMVLTNELDTTIEGLAVPVGPAPIGSADAPSSSYCFGRSA